MALSGTKKQTKVLNRPRPFMYGVLGHFSGARILYVRPVEEGVAAAPLTGLRDGQGVTVGVKGFEPSSIRQVLLRMPAEW
jgi:hypothetical protein